MRARTRGSRAGVLAALLVVGVLVTAVLFHVALAQGQLQLDRLDASIASAQREYEHRRLETSRLASPQRVIEQALTQGLQIPDQPAIYLEVPGAKGPAVKAADPPTTLGDWQDVKPSLGDDQP